MAATPIGAAKCPLCGGTARLSLAKSQLTVMTMNCCNAQLFARSDRSDSLMRGLLLPATGAAEPTPAAVEVKKSLPAAPPPPPAEPAVTSTPVRTEKPYSGFGGLIKW